MKGMRQKFSGKRGAIKLRPMGRVIKLTGTARAWRIQ